MTKIQRYNQIVACYTQKLFQISFCILKDRELAQIVAEKSLVTAYKTFETIDFSQWEHYLLKLTAKSALLCKKSTIEEKKRLLEKRRQKANEPDLVSTESDIEEKNDPFTRIEKII
ncbi:hypothetical protein [Niallia sp. 03133]|uniref:hypothetical protein n=1 Tax=Niallia sp. 03133 TaxID=3458060 RepID=UPI00404478B4